MSYFVNAVTKHYADFSGRASRREYWMYVLFAMIFGFSAMILDNVLGSTFSDSPYGWIYVLFGLISFLPGWSVAVRRLHDTGRSGWFLLLAGVPLIGAIWLIVLMCGRSAMGPNRYGPPPRVNSGDADPLRPDMTGASAFNGPPATRACPECGESILSVARKCKHCGSPVTPLLVAAP